MLAASEMRPMMAGKNAPPMMAITSSDDPRFVSGPRFLMLRRKNRGEHDRMKETDQHDGRTPASRLKQTINQGAEKRAAGE